MSEEWKIHNFITGEDQPLPKEAFSGEPPAAFGLGWDACMDGMPKNPPACLMDWEVEHWIEGWEAAEMD